MTWSLQQLMVVAQNKQICPKSAHSAQSCLHPHSAPGTNAFRYSRSPHNPHIMLQSASQLLSACAKLRKATISCVTSARRLSARNNCNWTDFHEI